MPSARLYEAAFPFADDVLALPVDDIDRAAAWYAPGFGLVEVERRDHPVPAVILERDGVRIGFAVNGGDPANEGAAIRVTDIRRARDELEANGVKTANWRVDERDGERYQVFFGRRAGRPLLLLSPSHRRVTHSSDSIASRRRYMPDDGLSFGNSVPSPTCLVVKARARRAASARRGM